MSPVAVTEVGDSFDHLPLSTTSSPHTPDQAGTGDRGGPAVSDQDLTYHATTVSWRSGFITCHGIRSSGICRSRSSSLSHRSSRNPVRHPVLSVPSRLPGVGPPTPRRSHPQDTPTTSPLGDPPVPRPVHCACPPAEERRRHRSESSVHDQQVVASPFVVAVVQLLQHQRPLLLVLDVVVDPRRARVTRASDCGPGHRPWVEVGRPT